MRLHYYVLVGDHPDQQKQALESIESIQIYFLNHASGTGELFLATMPGLKIEFDLYSGDVHLRSVEFHERITQEFSAEAFEEHVLPVKSAIHHVAKQTLLTELYKLGDPGICQLIKEYHKVDEATGAILTGLNNSHLNFTLLEIKHLTNPNAGNVLTFATMFSSRARQISPIQKAVFDVFSKYELSSHKLNAIQSRKMVESIIDTIRKMLAGMEQTVSQRVKNR